MSDPITWKPPGANRFPFVHELRARVTDADIENRVIKLKSDVNVALRSIDEALGNRSKYWSPPAESFGVEGRSQYVGPVEHRGGGRIVGIR